MSRMIVSLLRITSLASLVTIPALYAQVANNTALVGTVTDASGGVIANASVTAVNESTGISYPGSTNGQGYYSIQFILPGTYDITVEQQGFEKAVSKGIAVQLNMAARTDVKMLVGSANTEVLVTASTPALSTDDAMIGETLGVTKLENLPIAGRRPLDLATTASNVLSISGNPYTGGPPGVSFIGAGTRPVHNSITLDGITVMNSLGSTTPVNPNADALQAVQTQTGNFTAQYGSYMGVHINMDTKSGTNELHGTAYEYLQNDLMDAKSFFTRTGVTIPELRFNQFGGVVGGPVIIPKLYNGRDKLFFLGSYEGLRQISASTTVGTVLTAAMRTGNFSAITTPLKNPATGALYPNNQVTNISPIATKFLAYMPMPNVAGTTNNLVTGTPTNININSTLDRVDYAIGPNIRLFGRYYWQSLTALSGSLIPTNNTSSPTHDSNGEFGYTQVITPNLINDFRFGYNKLTSNLLNAFAENGMKGAGSALGIPGFTMDVDGNNPGIPSASITNYLELGSDGTNWYQDDRTLHGYDQVSWTRGRHQIMAGIELRKMSIGRSAQNSPRGIFTFSGTYSGSAPADFMSGYASTVITPVSQIKGSVAEWRDGFFVEDNWQVSHKVTLQYGLRYELPTVPYSLNGYGRIINQSYTALIPATTATTGTAYTPVPGFKFIGPNHDNWAPRLGFAYRATERIVVRGGGGMFYNPNHLNAFTLATGNYPLANTATYNGPTTSPATLNLSNPTGTGAPAANCVPGTLGCYTSIFNDAYNLPTPRMYQWNLDTGTELWRNAALELGYIGSHSIHLDHSFYANQPLPGAGVVNARRPNQLFGQIRQIQDTGLAFYNGLNVAVRQRLSHGLDMTLGYTWAHALDTSPDANSTSGNATGTPMIQYDLKADWGNANWDVRNRFVGIVNYTLPNLDNHGTALRLAAGGWQANTIVTLSSGMPFNIAMSNDQANAGNLGAQRPMAVTKGRATCSGSTVVNGTSCIQVSGIYTLPNLYTYGNIHRNDLYGPGLENVNFSIFKNFPIFERVTFQLRGEAFNLFNHPNPANPNVTLGTVPLADATHPGNPATGNRQIDPATGLSAFGASNFGTITSVQNSTQNGGGARLLQIAGKINF
jgi:Carboxypeptidase regulatory-like domain/TonB dependent receptor